MDTINPPPIDITDDHFFLSPNTENPTQIPTKIEVKATVTAVKKVLALSMTSFRGELEKGEIPDQSKDYIKTVLGEIHRHPLDAIAPDKLPKEEQKIMQTIRESMLSYFKNLKPPSD